MSTDHFELSSEIDSRIRRAERVRSARRRSWAPGIVVIWWAAISLLPSRSSLSAPQLRGERPEGMAHERRERIGLAPLVHPLVVLALGERDLEPHPLARSRLDAVVLVVLAQEVAGDPEQPRRA